MSNAYDNASLIVTPNGYEAGTIFSLKPTDGSGDLSFTRSTKKMVRNAQGSWQEIAINMPPLHYPVGGGCPSWLFEPQRTNLIPNCNTFAGDTTKTTGITDSPISGVTSVRLTKAIAGIEYAVTRYSATITNDTKYASSLFFKYDGYDIDSSLEFNNGGDFGVSWKADIKIRSTGVTILSTQNCTAQLISEANGWYRLEVSLTTGTVSTNTGSILITAAGTNGASFLVCTSQLELGSTATSPIITAGATVTRGADVSTTTGLSALIGQTEGTIYTQFGTVNNDSTAQGIFGVKMDANNYISIYRSSANIVFDITVGGVQIFIRTATWADNSKAAITYANNSMAAFLNGAKVGATDTAGTPPAASIVEVGCFLGAYPLNGLVKPCELYTTALSDSEAINLTTI